MDLNSLDKLPAARAYIFDIDGTLLNLRDSVHYNAFRKALREVFGIDAWLEPNRVHGNTDIGILRAIATDAGKARDLEEHLPRAISLMCSEVERNRADLNPELCPSVEILLHELDKEGKLLGVASGGLEPIAWAKIEAAGLRAYFSFGSFSGKVETREEIFRAAIQKARALLPCHDPAVAGQHDVCFIGDTPADIFAARAVGAPIVAVATGIFGIDELRKHSPDLCLSCGTELLSPDGVSIPQR